MRFGKETSRVLLHEEASWSHGVMVSTQDSESCNPSSNLGGTLIFFAQEKGNEKKHGKGKKVQSVIPCGLVVRIRRFHRRGRGSIPRMGAYFFLSPLNTVCRMNSELVPPHTHKNEKNNNNNKNN